MDLSKDDEAYRVLLEEANKVQLAGKSRQYTVAYLVQQHGIKKTKAYKIITDAIEVFGDINKSSREGLRYLQTEWYLRMAEKMKEEGHYDLAIACRQRVDRINGLEDKKTTTINISKVLMPKQLLFTTDPRALEIQRRMDEILQPKGILVESVLLKSIQLPKRIADSIERKLESEQEALRLGSVAEQERREVERKIIEEEGVREMATIRAEGQRDAALIAAEAQAQAAIIRAKAEAEATEIEAEALRTYNQALNETLTSRLIELKRVEAFQAIGEGPNTKLLLHDGKSQLINVLGGAGLGN